MPKQTPGAAAEPVERIARCFYESLFVGDWCDVRGIERDGFLQAAGAVLELLGEMRSQDAQEGWHGRTAARPAPPPPPRSLADVAHGEAAHAGLAGA